jgi:pimeloyl-ACP methyl ester carboxylesterase
MSVLFVGDALVHYEVLGRGRPVVFLHTWGASWRYWAPSMQALSASYRSYALDLYGSGETSHASHLYDVEAQADLVAAFMDEMGLRRAALIGHGLGALVALLLGKSRPDRVARLMIVGIPLDHRQLAERLRRQSLPDLLGWLANGRLETLKLLVDADKADPAALAASVVGEDVRSAMHSVQSAGIPLLLVYGASDPLSHLEGLPPAGEIRTIQLEDAGHFIQLDDAPRFQRLLVDFLAADSGTDVQGLQVKDEWRRRVR